MVNFKEIHTKSNYLSIFRIFLAIPIWFIIGHFYDGSEYRWYLFGLFFIAYMTDLLDGFLARKFNEITEMGKILDPLADKIVVLTIVVKFYLDGIIPEFYFWIIILRDIIIFIGGIFISNKIGKVLPSNNLGKGTVFSIMMFFLAVIFDAENDATWLYNFLLYTSTFLSFASVFGYAIRGYEAFKWSVKTNRL